MVRTSKGRLSKRAKPSEVALLWRRIADAKSKLSAEYENKKSVLDQKQEELEHWFLERAEREGVKNFPTTHGTVYSTDETKASCSDWAALEEYVIEQEDATVYEKRIHRGNVQKILDETGELPPGVELQTTRRMRLRRT